MRRMIGAAFVAGAVILGGCLAPPDGAEPVTQEQYEVYQLSMMHATATGALTSIRLVDTEREIISDELWNTVINPLIQESNEAILRLGSVPPGELRIRLIAEINAMLTRLAAEQARFEAEGG